MFVRERILIGTVSDLLLLGETLFCNYYFALWVNEEVAGYVDVEKLVI